MNDNGVQHFARLKETSDLVWPIIEREVENLYENLRVYDDDKAVLKSEMEVFFKRRRHKLLLRPYLTRLAYEFYGGKDWKKNIDVFAAVELFNISTYQSNLCFDKKLMNEVANNSNQYIASMLTLSLATKLIQDSQIFSSEQKNRAIQLLNESNNKVYLGQYIDLNMLTFSKFKSYQYQKNQYGIVRYKKKHFYHDYVERCNKIGGSTFEVCLIGALLNSNTDLEKVEELRNLYYKFGSANQVINDLADYCHPEKTKRVYTHNYNDLLMEKLTLPAFFLLSRAANQTEIPKIISDTPTLENCLKLSEELRQMNIKGKVEKFIRQYFWNGENGIGQFFSNNLTNNYIDSFIFIRKMLFGSKYLRCFDNNLQTPQPGPGIISKKN